MRKIARWAIATAVLCILGVSIGAILLYNHGFFAPPDMSLLNETWETSKIYDDNGKLLKEYGEYWREEVPLEAMGELPKLVIAAEDRDFWTRWTPISTKGVARALWQNAKTWKISQGGSTISQQFARIAFAQKELADEWVQRTLSSKFWRKGRELWLACGSEEKFPRKKILELYLNLVYCGYNRYGVQSASHYYFDKNANALQVQEAALLIGLIRSPGTSPFRNPKGAQDLRDRVLEQFVEAKLITPAEKSVLTAMPLPKRKIAVDNGTEHFTEYVRRQVTQDKKLVDQGLTIHTTLNSDWQKVAADALRQSMDAMKKRNPEMAKDLRGAAVLLDARTGAIKVWVQEPEFTGNEYLLDQLDRQTGSAFKPFFVAAWLEKGGRLSCEDEGNGPCMLDDSFNRGDGRSILGVHMGNGTMHYIMNFPYLSQARYRGLIPAIEALAQSRNAAVMSGMEMVRNSRADAFLEDGKYVRVTKDEVLAMAIRLGIKKPKVDPGLTISIGSIGTSPLQMAEAWTGFSGERAEPYAVQKIYGSDGKLEFTAQSIFTSVMDERIALQLIRGLRATVEFPHGTGQSVKRELDFQVCGKTGTATNTPGQATDNWFCGATPSYVMVIWIGRDKKLPLGRPKALPETGGRNCLSVFVATMKRVYAGKTRDAFSEKTDPRKPFWYYVPQTQSQTQPEDFPK